MIFGKTFWGGLLLLVASFFTPSRFLIQSLRDFPTDPVLAEQLLQGAHLFRVGLAIVGAILIALSAPAMRQRLGLSDPSHPIEDEKDPYVFPLISLLILSVILRLYKLGEGLWLDEIGMWFKYLQRPFGELLTTYDSENQHLLYTILAHICTTLWGDT